MNRLEQLKENAKQTHDVFINKLNDVAQGDHNDDFRRSIIAQAINQLEGMYQASIILLGKRQKIAFSKFHDTLYDHWRLERAHLMRKGAINP